MNYVIGICNNSTDWPDTLHKLEYRVAILEKSIRTSSNQIVVPDIIAVSKKYTHSIAFDCKGGNTIKDDQVGRYKTLQGQNFVNWVDIHDPDHMTVDVCFAGLESNFARIMQAVGKDFPILTFHNDRIAKENSFHINALNTAFRNPISLKDTNPPLSYYPFSENDDRCEIIPHMLRALVSVVTDRVNSGTNILSDNLLDDEEVLRKIHKMWDALSQEHREVLVKKMKEIFSILKEKYKDTFSKQLEDLQTRVGTNIHSTLRAFSNTCNQIMEDCNKQMKVSQKLLSEFES
jgi:hypothetical protein